MKETDSHAVVFRLHRTEADGSTTVEEREVRCDELQLKTLLCQPWETVPTAEGTCETTQGLAESAARALAQLRLVVTETPAADGGRAWRIGFESQSTAAEAEAAQGWNEPLDLPPAEAGPLRVGGSLSLALQGDEAGPVADLAQGAAAIHVENQALSLVNCGNVNAIVNLNLTVEIHPDREGCEPGAQAHEATTLP